MKSSKIQSEQDGLMKKFRSKLLRRKRSPISPILCSSPALVLSNSIHSSNLTTREVSCDSSIISANKLKPLLKKRGYDETNEKVGEGKFRRITRSYSRQKHNETITKETENEIELSEYSCVESCISGERSSSSKNRTRKGYENLKENSEVTARSESIAVSSEILKGDVNSIDITENDVVSVTSETKIGNIASSINNFQNRASENEVSEVSLNCVESNFSEATSKEISKLVSVNNLDLTCSEHYEDEYSSAECSDTFLESSEIDFSSDYTPSIWYESGSQFSERSVGDTSPSPMFQQFLLYSQQFCKSKFSEVSSRIENNESSDGVIKLLRLDNEEEECYQIMRKRERRQVYLYDYSEEYCRTTDHGQLVSQQRLQMVNWIVEQSTSKDYQRETMFLGVSLLDRFLSKGYFKNKRNLQIAGIACLTLATRIEENQPFNSVQQKSFHIESNQYSRCEVVAMEWLVQEVLNFQCSLPTIYNFLWFYLQAARVDEEVEKNAKYLAVLALLAHKHLCFWPSTVAAGLVILACAAANNHSFCNQITKIFAGSKDNDVSECIKSLEWLVKYIC